MNDGDVRYRILSVVGQGGFGRVYRARLEAGDGFHKDVAIKVLSDVDPPRSLLRRFRDEAKILGLVRDRAIVGVGPPIHIGDRWAVVMDFVDGESAGGLLARGSLPPGVAVEIIGEVARALHNAFLMEGPEGEPLQLLHRDIKPDNIQITPTGEVRLIDFGIARANFAAREFHTRQSLGGTPGYIAPERLHRIEVPEGDVFSLGVVLHELVTGAVPRFTPTIQFGDDLDESDAHVQPVGSKGLTVDLDGLEVDEALLADPALRKVLTLAGWMRAYNHEERPSPRQVEEACRQLRQELPVPFFRDWAETAVEHRHELEPDELVGEVLAQRSGPTLTPAPAGSAPTMVPATTPSVASLPPSLPLVPQPTPAPIDQRPAVALGAAVGTGFAVLAVGAMVLLLVGVLGTGWWLWSMPSAPVHRPVDRVDVPQPAPGPVVEPVPAAGPVPAAPSPSPIPAPVMAPLSPAPSPAPIGDELTVITLPGAGTADPVAPASAPQPAARPERVGLVVVKTVPAGATVRENGTVLSKTGRGYLLSVGHHVLDLESPTGEHTRVPVQVRIDATVEFCYSFDDNAACGE